MKRFKSIFVFSLLLFSMSTAPPLLASDLVNNTVATEEVPNNTTDNTNNSGTTTNNNADTNGSGDLSNDMNELAGSVDEATNSLEHALTGMMGDMAKADDGKVASKASSVMSKIYGIVAQVCRIIVIIGLILLSGPDLLTLAFPACESFFAGIGFGGRSNNGMSGSASATGGMGNGDRRCGLLSADYYAAASCRGSGGNTATATGGMGDGQNNQNPFAVYIKLHLKTLIFATIAIAIFLTPLGLAILIKVVSLIFKAFSGLLKVIGGVA